MKKLILVLVIAINFMPTYAQKSKVWQKVNVDNITAFQKIRTTNYSQRQQFFQVNISEIRQQLAIVKNRTSGLAGTEIEFPNSNGDLEKFLVWENSNFEAQLQLENPEIRAYMGSSVIDGATINFSMSQFGIQTFVSRPTDGSEFIEPYTKDNSIYVLFDSKTRTTGRLPFNCSTADKALTEDLSGSTNVFARANNRIYKTMRLALSCVGEYGIYHGGNFAGTLAAMNATMSRVNGVLEKDIALHLNIIADNNLVMYYNPATDPYAAVVGGNTPATWNVELQNTLTTVLGNAAYDIGHLFGQTGGGGNAGCIGCVCVDDDVVDLTDTEKGSAYTSPYDGISQGDNFDIDYVVHEIGHQLGGTHSFSFGGIGGSEVSPAGVEPGSGSTIMGYAGITNYDVQPHSDAYYTYRNILEIQTNLAPKSCPVSVPTNNTPPVVSAGPDFSIPSGTAYKLTGSATDIDGDILTYCWEQFNVASSNEIGAACIVSPTKTRGPNYRSFNPTSSPVRFMPAYAKVLAGNLTLASGWESVSTVARTSPVGRLTFTLTARDNNVTAIGGGQQTNTDTAIILSQAPYNTTTVPPSGAGPFRITSQNTVGTVWGAAASSQTITWDVNNTTTLAGSANINIKLSIDGGITWPYDLALNTPNDGTETISVPATPASTNCRLWIEPVGNIYYAVNAAPFYIGYAATNTCTTYLSNTTADNATPFNIPDNVNSYVIKRFATPALNVSDVNITINATHSNLQNLKIDFARPSGTLTSLYNQQCVGNANMNVIFDSQGAAFLCGSPTTGTYSLPVGTLNSLNGAIPAGNWTFGFKDIVAGDVGLINSMSLEICSQAITLLANDNFNFENFVLSPNPNNGSFNVRFNAAADSKTTVIVNDIRGRKILEKSFNNSGLFSENIELENAQKGIYLVTIKSGDKQIVKKIIVE